MGDATLTVKVPKEKRDELKEVSERTGIQAGSIIRNLLYEFLEKERQRNVA